MNIQQSRFAIDSAKSAKKTVHAQFEAHVKTLEQEARTTCLEARIAAVDELIEQYVLAVGTTPPSALLSRLANVIHHDYLSAKVKPYLEYPFMSARQLRTADEGRRIPVSNIVFVAVDGRDYSLPFRTARRVTQGNATY